MWKYFCTTVFRSVSLIAFDVKTPKKKKNKSKSINSSSDIWRWNIVCPKKEKVATLMAFTWNDLISIRWTCEHDTCTHYFHSIIHPVCINFVVISFSVSIWNPSNFHLSAFNLSILSFSFSLSISLCMSISFSSSTVVTINLAITHHVMQKC